MTDSTRREQEDKQLEQWLLKLDSGDLADAEYERMNRWLAKSPENRDRFAALSVVWYGSALVESTTPSVERVQRRRPSKSIALALAACLVLGFGIFWIVASKQAGDIVVPNGQILAQSLSDGTEISAEPGTVLDIEMTPHRRGLVLRSGAIFLDAAEDANRPLQVLTSDAVVTVVGTRFGVAIKQNSTQVGVHSGMVDVQVDGGQSERLTPGQAARIDVSGLSLFPLRANAFSWKDGQIVLEGQTLAEALDTIARYSARRTLILRSLPEESVNAVVAVDSADEAIDALARDYELSVFKPPGFTIIF